MLQLAKVQTTLSETLFTQSKDWLLISFKICEWAPLNGDMKGAADRLKDFNHSTI